jgi:hypothetical protein
MNCIKGPVQILAEALCHLQVLNHRRLPGPEPDSIILMDVGVMGLAGKGFKKIVKNDASVIIAK